MDSVWNKTAKRPNFENVAGITKTDVLIIGGGIAGLLCAYMLRGEGVDCVVAEAENICSGITANTTAKITIQHGLIFDKMLRRFGEKKARLYLQAQGEAREKFEELCKAHPSDFEKCDSFVYSVDNRRIIEREVAALNKLGIAADFTDNLPLPIETAGAVRVANQAQFHPLRFIYSVAEGLPVLENTRVLKLTDDGALTTRGKISCKKIIVATHFPIFNRHGLYFLKMYQHRSYVLALENAERVCGMYVDEKDTGLSFRNYGDLLLLGGGGHRTGKTGGGVDELREFARLHYPNAREKFHWAAQDCMTLDDISYIGRYSATTPDLFVATGFNKWGMTSSMVAAELLCDMVQGRENKYEEVFSPMRSIFRPQLFANAIESTIGLITPTTPRCSHLGCALKYNKFEHSWDCSCHGSRFSDEGEWLSGPANSGCDIK